MQHIRNGLIMHLTNSLKNNICLTNFTPKIIINFKKLRTAIEIASLDKNNLFICHNHVQNNRKLPVHDHMTHVVIIDILTGHEKKGNLHFILRIIFYCIFIEKTCIFSKLVQLNMKV